MNLNKIVIGAFLSVAASLTAAHASANMHDVVVDHNGKHVISTNGNCVRTMWMRANDVCGMHEVKNPTWVFFDFDKSNINESEKHKLERVAGYINDHGIETVSIYGHADRLGSHHYNDKLSAKRADAVLGFLKARTNVSDMKRVDLKAFGDHRQVKACEGVQGDDLIPCLQPNRRVEVLMKE